MLYYGTFSRRDSDWGRSPEGGRWQWVSERREWRRWDLGVPQGFFRGAVVAHDDRAESGPPHHLHIGGRGGG